MQIVDLRGKLPVHPVRTYGTRLLSDLQWLVVHHTAGSRTQTPEQIARFHVTTDYLTPGGAPGIAYPMLVDADGIGYKCWGADVATWCVRRGNLQSYCLVGIGNFEVEPPTPNQWDALVQIGAAILRGYSAIRRIYGHFQAPTVPPQATRCPGRYFDLVRYAHEVRAYALAAIPFEEV